MTPEWSKENGLDLLTQPVANTLFLWASSSSMLGGIKKTVVASG